MTNDNIIKLSDVKHKKVQKMMNKPIEVSSHDEITLMNEYERDEALEQLIKLILRNDNPENLINLSMFNTVNEFAFYPLDVNNINRNHNDEICIIISLLVKFNYTVIKKLNDYDVISITNYPSIRKTIDEIFSVENNGLYLDIKDLIHKDSVGKNRTDDTLFDQQGNPTEEYSNLLYRIESLKYKHVINIIYKIYEYSNTKFMQYMNIMKPNDMIDTKSARVTKVISVISHEDDK